MFCTYLINLIDFLIDLFFNVRMYEEAIFTAL